MSDTNGVLAGIDDKARERLCSSGEVLALKKGDIVISQGDMQGNLFIVLSGQLHVVDESTKGKAPRFICALEAGDSFGEVSLFDGEKASATVKCSTRCEILRIDGDGFKAYLAEDPANGSKILFQLGVLLARRLRQVNERITDVWREYVTRL